LINVMVGESDARNQGARSEARPAIHQFFMKSSVSGPRVPR